MRERTRFLWSFCSIVFRNYEFVFRYRGLFFVTVIEKEEEDEWGRRGRASRDPFLRLNIDVTRETRSLLKIFWSKVLSLRCAHFMPSIKVLEKKFELNTRNRTRKTLAEKREKWNEIQRTRYVINISTSAPTDPRVAYGVLLNSLFGTEAGEDRPTQFHARKTAIHHTAERTADALFLKTE